MGDTPISNRDFAVSIALMLVAALTVALMALAAKTLTGEVGLKAAVVLRFVVPFLLLAWLAYVVLDEQPAFGDWRIHAARSAFALAAQYCFFFYLDHASLLLATLLFSTSGLFLPFITSAAFGMEIRAKTLAAIAVSFAGVAVVLDPAANFHWVMLVGLLSGALNAGSQAVMHKASKTVSTLSSTLAMFALCSVAAMAIYAATGGAGVSVSAVTGNHDGRTMALLVLVIAIGVLTISNQSLRTKAYRYVNKPASLSPFYYASIVFSGLLDWTVYDIVPTWNVYAGSLLIFIGGAIMAWRGRVPAPETAPPAPDARQ